MYGTRCLRMKMKVKIPKMMMMTMKMKIWIDLREWNFIFFQYIKSDLSSILLLILSTTKIFIICIKMAKKLCYMFIFLKKMYFRVSLLTKLNPFYLQNSMKRHLHCFTLQPYSSLLKSVPTKSYTACI